jgi:low temperature requirement protein LtrA
VFVVLVHAWLFGHSAGEGGARGILRLVRSNIPGALLILLGGVLGGDAQVVLWTAAVLLLWIVPRVVGIESFEVAPAHFVERHGLVIIVAIGESVVAIGIGASALPIDVELALVAALGLLLSAGLWWTYFGGDDVRAEEALVRLPPRRRPLAALDAFGYAHYLMLLGIVCLAVGLKQATAHAYDPLSAGRALVLAGGVATFLAADVWFRRILCIGAAPARMAGAALALATIPLGRGSRRSPRCSCSWSSSRRARPAQMS